MRDYKPYEFRRGDKITLEYNRETGMFVIACNGQMVARRNLRGKQLIPVLGLFD